MHICIVCWHSVRSPLPRCPRCGELEARSRWPKLPWPLPGHKHLTLQAYHDAGGQGVVYRAIDSNQDKEVAVKLLARNLSEDEYEDEIDRFAREKAAMDFISHAASLPMFVDVYDFHRGSQEPDLDQAPAFLEMEFIPWPTLGNVIRGKGRLPMHTVFLVGLELAQALRIMSRRIIHNDIKPYNLFVNIKRGKVDLKIADFGIWVPDDDKVVTQVGAGPAIAGTIAYMSPEQSSGDRWDSRSDIYAACCVLWQCCTGSRPFPHITARLSIAEQLAERQRVTQECPSRPESIPPELYEVLRKGLRYDRHDRHENANEFRSHLQDAFREWRMRMDEERRAYLAKLEGFAAVIAAQRQKLSAYYLAYVELSGFASDIEGVLGALRDDPPTRKFGREDAKTRNLEHETTIKFEAGEDPLDLSRIESAIGKTKQLLENEQGEGVAEQEVPTVDLRAPTSSLEQEGPTVAFRKHETSDVKSIYIKGDDASWGDVKGGDVKGGDVKGSNVKSDEEVVRSAAASAVPHDSQKEARRGRMSMVVAAGVVAVIAMVTSYVFVMGRQRGVESVQSDIDPQVEQRNYEPSVQAGAWGSEDGGEVSSADRVGSGVTGARTGTGAGTETGAGTGAGAEAGSGATGVAGAGADTDTDTNTNTNTDAGVGGAATTASDQSSEVLSASDARRAQWLESALSANDQRSPYGRQARIAVKSDGHYQLSFKRTTCALLFGPDGNPERLKNCKNYDEDWWYLSKVVRLRCRDNRCSGRYEWFDGDDGEEELIWLKIKKQAAAGQLD